jgi:hypothetical protein
VGGYAVAAYGVPRYSVDVDLVVPTSARKQWISWLRTHRLTPKQVYHSPDVRMDRVELQRWQRGVVTVDLMIGGVRDRDTGVTIPGEWLLQSPRSVRLDLLSGSLTSPVVVVRLEGLWATKLLAGRPHDITDLFGIMSQVVDLGEVRHLFEGFSGDVARRKFRETSNNVRDRRTYVDSLSRLRRGSPENPNNVARWKHFVEMVSDALPLTSHEH